MLELIFLLVVIVFLLVPVFTYLIFWYEAANSLHERTLYRESNGKPFVWILKGLLSSMGSNLLVVCLFPLGLVKKLWAPDGAGTESGPALVFIHGLYHNPSAWIYFRRRLRRKGYGRIYAFSYGSWGSDFWEIYQKFESWMKGVERDAADNGILLVGHSLGGLLAKTYAGKQPESGNASIQRVITLGTPFRGSKMVVFGFGKLAKSLRYQGALARELSQYEPAALWPSVAFYSPVDNMVHPADSMMPPPGWIKEETAPLCHTAILYHGPTFDRILKYLAEGNSKSG